MAEIAAGQVTTDKPGYCRVYTMTAKRCESDGSWRLLCKFVYRCCHRDSPGEPVPPLETGKWIVEFTLSFLDTRIERA